MHFLDKHFLDIQISFFRNSERLRKVFGEISKNIYVNNKLISKDVPITTGHTYSHINGQTVKSLDVISDRMERTTRLDCSPAVKRQQQWPLPMKRTRAFANELAVAAVALTVWQQHKQSAGRQSRQAASKRTTATSERATRQTVIPCMQSNNK